MNEVTILIWIVILIIAIIAIALVKSRYGNKDDENEDDILSSNNTKIEDSLPKINNSDDKNTQSSLSPETPEKNITFKKRTKTPPKNDVYIVPEVEKNNLKNYEYENQNKVLINYNNKVKKFQEPIKQNQIDIMSQINKNKDETELKDLFTIDELIKESKRKDSQREKESQTIKKDEKDDKELNEIKESIKNKTEEPLIEEIVNNDEKESEPKEKQTLLTQQDVDNAIKEASNEIKIDETPSSNPSNITNILLTEEKKQKEELEKISEPTLKTPVKSSEKITADNSTDSEEEGMDLDYRKDLDKFTNKIKGSKIYQEVKDKFTPDVEEYPTDDDFYIKNVNDYDDYKPIMNETHVDYEAKYGYSNLSEEELLRQENTKKVFNLAKNSPKTKSNKSNKNKASKSSIKLTLNNNEVTLKKGDEIIFNHLGETYSSQVYAINGDEISVKYRRKQIKIKPKDVKKIY